MAKCPPAWSHGRLAEARKVFCRDARKVKRRLDQVMVRRGELVSVESLGVAAEPANLLRHDGIEGQGGMECEEFAERRAAARQPGALQEGGRMDRSGGENHQLGADFERPRRNGSDKGARRRAERRF